MLQTLRYLKIQLGSWFLFPQYLELDEVNKNLTWSDLVFHSVSVLAEATNHWIYWSRD